MPPRPRTAAGAPAIQPRIETAPALFRLLSDSALARAALSACGFAVALADARSPGQPITYVNAAFERLFGYREAEARGRGVADLLFRGDSELAQNLFGEPASRRKLSAWGKDGGLLPVEVAVSALRGADGGLTHWILAFTDRSEIERVREELASLKSPAAAG
jgi:PAS domain S-box-containing protein